MYKLSFPSSKKQTHRLLCLGAHSDDLEIGCGGTILRLSKELRLSVDWIVFSGEGERAKEAQSSAAAFLSDVNDFRISVLQYRDGHFPYLGSEIKDSFEQLKKIKPDLILTHTRHDRHQDHRLINELTWNTFRKHLIWEYEIPKYDADLGSPNLYVTLTQNAVKKKTRLLMKHFPTQRAKNWFSEEVFTGLMRLRGVESASPSGYAEAFYARKSVL